MNIQSAINREVFAPSDEKLLVAIVVRRRKRRRLPFLTVSRKGAYVTFLCLSVTNKRPAQVFITKVKQHEGSPGFIKRSQWTLEQLRQVNGVNPNKDCPEFDLVFDHSCNEWVAGSTAEKCMFVQVLYHVSQNSLASKLSQASPEVPGDQRRPDESVRQKKDSAAQRHTEFINCQPKLLGDACSMNMVIYRCKIFLSRMKNTMTSNQGQPQVEASFKGPWSSPSPPARRSMRKVVRRASQVLSVRGDRLAQAEDKTAHLMQSARLFAETAQKLALKQMK